MRTMRWLGLAGFLTMAVLFSSTLTVGQPLSQADQAMQDLLKSNVEGNVPDESHFMMFLEGDLKAYFASAGYPNPDVKFELLRKAPTQVGIAFPKFYLWVRVSSSSGITSGAVRVAAIQKREFAVTDFWTASEINADPNRLSQVFPAALLPAIKKRAAP